jgi:hypothetical protein
MKGLVAIAIATAVRKKSLAAAEPAIRFSETPPRRERALDHCSRIETPPCSDEGSVAMDPVIEGDHLCNKKPAILPFT